MVEILIKYFRGIFLVLKNILVELKNNVLLEFKNSEKCDLI